MQFEFLYQVAKPDTKGKMVHVCNLHVHATAHVRQHSTFFNPANFKAVRIELTSIKITHGHDELLPLIDAITCGEIGQIETAAETFYRDCASLPITETQPA